MIARQNDCQTCFLCEIYCPTDALYVAPDAEGPTAVCEAEVEEKACSAAIRGHSDGGAASPAAPEKDPTFRLRAASR